MKLLDTRRIRPLITLVFVVLGGCVGYRLAGDAGVWLESKFLSAGDTGEAVRLLGIPVNPTRLTATDKTALFAGFVVAGILLGFAIERLAFIQAKRARSQWESMAWQDKVAVFAGVGFGILITLLLRNIFSTPWWANVIVASVLCYISVVAFESLMEQVRFYFPALAKPGVGDDKRKNRPKLLDTNVIIDGRIADICRAGFMEGPIYVPGFVLEELQQIADSSDSLKRARGRRGLDILNQMQKEMDLQVPHYALDPSEEVDARLVKAAKQAGGAIVTNDYNLNRVAELQGVDVLNINELANAVKPVVLPGEEMQVLIIREGKEKEQGIGYLDDGTMIVVEGARRLIGETLQINVTSVLQTVQGKMIFGKIKGNGENGEAAVDESFRSYTGGRPRRKIR
jgi:uncharacterized protein YacL